MKEDTGTDLIRKALRARNAKVNLATFGRDLGLSGDQIHGFIFNNASLTPDKVQAICHYLWGGNTVWDPVTDKLRPAKPFDPIPQGIMPPPFDPKLLPKWKAGPAGPGPQLVSDDPNPVKHKTRPGWASGPWW